MSQSSNVSVSQVRHGDVIQEGDLYQSHGEWIPVGPDPDPRVGQLNLLGLRYDNRFPIVLRPVPRST